MRMVFAGKRPGDAGDRRAWYSVILYLSLAIIWFVLSEVKYGSGNGLNYFDLRTMLFCKGGLIAGVYLERYLLFRDSRLPGFGKWATGFFLAILLVWQFSKGIQPSFWLSLIWMFPDKLIFSIFLALATEVILAVFGFWNRLPCLAPDLSSQYWDRLRREIVKLGLLVTLFMVFAYIYIVNFYLVDTVLYSYLLTVPVLAAGAGLFIIFAQKISGWREAEIRAIDRELAPYLDWRSWQPERDLQGVLTWFQYLQTIRTYLRRMKQPPVWWWTVSAYVLFGGVILSLPYLFKIAVAV